MSTMQEFLASVKQLCSVQSDTESPVDHLPHGHHGLSGWTLGFVKVLAISKTTKKYHGSKQQSRDPHKTRSRIRTHHSPVLRCLSKHCIYLGNMLCL